MSRRHSHFFLSRSKTTTLVGYDFAAGFFCSHPPLTLVESMLDMTETMLYLTDPLTFCISLTSSPTTQRLTVTTVRALRGTSPQGRFSRAAPSENFARLRVGSLGCPVSSEAFALTGSGLSGAAGLF